MDKQERNFILDFLAGAPIATLSTSVETPLNFIKSHEFRKNYYHQGFYNGIKLRMKEEGVFSFWRNNMRNLKKNIPLITLNFTIYDIIKAQLNSGQVKKKNTTHLGQTLKVGAISGAISGALSLTICHPIFQRMKQTELRLPSKTGKRKQRKQQSYKSLYLSQKYISSKLKLFTQKLYIIAYII